jgi:polysaccharide biosynthesis/export protein
VKRIVTLPLLFAFVCAMAPSLPEPSVQPGDKLDVVVFDHPDVSTQVTVANDGGIFVPLVGRVQAQGLLPQMIARTIEQDLKNGDFIESPAVDVRVLSQNETVFLTGAANATLALGPSETLAMAVAGATLPPDADLTNVMLRRGSTNSGPYNLLTIKTQQDTTPQLAPGDSINVPMQPVMVSVIGAVKAPLSAYLAANQPLAAALQNVQYADDANQQRVVLLRGSTTIVTARGGAVLDEPGQPGDQLLIPPVAHVTVLGFAGKPGVVALTGDTSLATALSLAGNGGKDCDLGHIVIISPTDPNVKQIVNYNAFLRNGDPKGNAELNDGDVVYVPKAHVLLTPKQLLLLAALAAKKAGFDLAEFLK